MGSVLPVTIFGCVLFIVSSRVQSAIDTTFPDCESIFEQLEQNDALCLTARIRQQCSHFCPEFLVTSTTANFHQSKQLQSSGGMQNKKPSSGLKNNKKQTKKDTKGFSKYQKNRQKNQKNRQPKTAKRSRANPVEKAMGSFTAASTLFNGAEILTNSRSFIPVRTMIEKRFKKWLSRRSYLQGVVGNSMEKWTNDAKESIPENVVPAL